MYLYDAAVDKRIVDAEVYCICYFLYGGKAFQGCLRAYSIIFR